MPRDIHHRIFVRPRCSLRMAGFLAMAAPLLGACQPDYRLRRVDPPPVDPFAASGGLGTICVVRPQAFGAVATARHYDNRHLVGVTQGAAVYFCYRAQPGWHDLTATTDNEARLRVALPPGGRAFVRYTLRVGPDLLEPMGEAEARRLLPGLSFVHAEPTHPEARPLHRTPVPAQGG